MKKFLLLLFVMFLSLAAINSAPIALSRNGNNSLKGNTDLVVNYNYDPDRYYHFIFSDVNVSKDGNFDDLFATTGLDWITLSTLKDGCLVNDKNVYVYWMIDGEQPIEKLTLEVPEPLKMGDKDTLDLYVSWDNKQAGGINGYGIANAQTIYDRNSISGISGNTDSVRLMLKTGNIKGKSAGNYTGTIILRVYGDTK